MPALLVRQDDLRRQRTVIEHPLEAGQLRVDHAAQRRGDVHVTACEFETHISRCPPPAFPSRPIPVIARGRSPGRRRHQYSTLRWFEVGIFSSSRYFAIVRRASTSPSRCRMLTIFESLSGFLGSSFSMILRMRCLIVTDETLSP